jgi:hypothetical protein
MRYAECLDWLADRVGHSWAHSSVGRGQADTVSQYLADGRLVVLTVEKNHYYFRYYPQLKKARAK